MSRHRNVSSNKGHGASEGLQNQPLDELDRPCLPHRLMNLPLIAYVLNDVVPPTYNWIKNINPFFNRSFRLVEGTANFTWNKAQPIAQPFVNMLDTPLVTVNRFLCSKLDGIITHYPKIEITPQEVKAVLKKYYERSIVHWSIVKVNSVYQLSSEKYRLTLRFASDAVDTFFYVFSLPLPDKIKWGSAKLDQGLVFSNKMIDNYLLPPDAPDNLRVQDPVDGSVLYRVFCLSLKVLHGSKYQLEIAAFTARAQVYHLLNRIGSMFLVVDHVRNVTNWATNTARNQIALRSQQTAEIVQTLCSRSLLYGLHPNIAVLHVLQRAMSQLTDVVDFVMNFSKHVTPSFIHRYLQAIVDELRDVEQHINQAQGLFDVKDEVLEEARRGLAKAKEAIGWAFELIAELPPLRWLVFTYDSFEFDDVDLYEREYRRPLDVNRLLAFGLPLLQIRNEMVHIIYI